MNSQFDKYSHIKNYDQFLLCCKKVLSNLSEKDIIKFIRILVVNHNLNDFSLDSLYKLQKHLLNISVSKLKDHEYDGYFMTSSILTKLRAICNYYNSIVDRFNQY